MNSQSNYSQLSQSSNDSALSRASRGNAIVKDGLPSSSCDDLARESTPSTSLSDESSREPSHSASSLRQRAINYSPRLAPDVGHTSPPSLENHPSQTTSVQSHLQNVIPPPKRTASGDIKRSGQPQQSSPHPRSPYSHSRHTSTASRSSHISDMSSDLCARLSYAMFKVQNGIQSHSLDQIEAMALPKLTSPTGTPQRRPTTYSPSSTFRPTDLPYSPGKRDSTQQSPGGRVQAAHQSQQPDHSLRSPRSQDSGLMGPSRQSIANAGTLEKAGSQHSPYRGPTLAPPADIHPRNPRRSRTDGAQQPRLDTRTIHGNSIHHVSLPRGSSTTPSTPPRGSGSAIRNPNAKSAEEQDAVETLMFMSSPGNSAYYPAIHGPASPRSSRFNNDPRHISTGRLSTTADIDRVLDQMPRDDSSSDEDTPFP
ncbi:MAG: hypothetical protein LQ339_002899 [Xanthoria mediterranea]|nr:MAG: hypothetical protein LQ339_002899 [Xanthoria mediterranea]